MLELPPRNEFALRESLAFAPQMRTAIFVLASILAISGCDQKKPTATPPPPIVKLADADLASAEDFAESIVAAAHEGDKAKLTALQDLESVWSESIRDLNAPKKYLAGMKSGFMSTVKSNGGLFGAYIGKPIEFIRAHERDGETVLLIRLREEAGGAGYHDFFLTRLPDGKFLVRDLFNYALGERATTLMQRIIAQSVAVETKSPLSQIFGGAKSTVKAADLEKAFGLSKFLQAGKFEELLTTSETLPAELRNERFVQFLRVQAAMALDDEPRYIKVMDELAAAFPKDPSVGFILMDRHFLKKDFKQALRSVDDLTRQLGNDAFLASLQATCLIALKQFDDAEAAIKAGLEVEPGDFAIQMVRVDLLAKKKDHAEVRKLLESLHAEFDQIIDPAKAEEAGLKEFFESPDGKAYTEFLKKAGEI